MLNEIIDTLIFPVVFGLPFLLVGGAILREHRAGKLKKSSGYVTASTLPAYNTDGTPMIPGSSFDATGSSYGNPSH